jgi:hypothetical protein
MHLPSMNYLNENIAYVNSQLKTTMPPSCSLDKIMTYWNSIQGPPESTTFLFFYCCPSGFMCPVNQAYQTATLNLPVHVHIVTSVRGHIEDKEGVTEVEFLV